MTKITTDELTKIEISKQLTALPITRNEPAVLHCTKVWRVTATTWYVNRQTRSLADTIAEVLR